MLRVGLTGGLGSGKSTVSDMLRTLGAEILSADELGRAMMKPGHEVFSQVVDVFGKDVLAEDGTLNRAKLAEIAFQGGRLQELNAIVHPAVIATQGAWFNEVLRSKPDAVAVVESALIFEVERDAAARGESDGLLADWRQRFDRTILVTAPDEVKIARYVARISPYQESNAAAADARARLARQMSDAEKTARADFVLENAGNLDKLRGSVAVLWQQLLALRN